MLYNKKINISDICTACGACTNICVQNAISMYEDKVGFCYPVVNVKKCINCGQCDTVCPELNNIKEAKLIKSAFYGWHKNDNIRNRSSSGGVFSALADEIIEKDGIVFGTIIDLLRKKIHHTSTKEVAISALRKSKYVQSSIGSSFRQAKHYLKENKNVLFCGTPCQIAGLNLFLGKDDPNLLTCDFICHGVPPVKLLNDHFAFLEKKYKSNIVDVDFRPKTYGWSTYSLKCVFLNGFKYEMPYQFDGYFFAFMSNISLRKSCYRCKYSAQQHHADLTVADFWGYQKFNPEINDENGISLIIANTKKGKTALSELHKINLFPINWKYAKYVFHRRNEKNYNRAERDYFFDYYLENGWMKTISKFHLSGTFKTRIKYFLAYKILDKIKK